MATQEEKKLLPGEGTQTATYIDANGDRQTGTYSAAAENAVVGNAQESSPPSHWDQMRGYYQQMYDEQVASNEAARAAAEQRAREATQEQLDALKTGYQGTNRQLYRDYMEHRRTLPQEMAARGYSGGMSESAMLRLRNSYEEGLNENERARMGQEAGANAALAQQLYEAQARATAADQQANQQRLGYLTALQEQQYQDQQQRAATMASAGDFSGYKDLGYSDEEIQHLGDVWASENPALAYYLGKIDGEKYYQITGTYPPGYGGGGGGGWYGGSTSESADKKTPANEKSSIGNSGKAAETVRGAVDAIRARRQSFFPGDNMSTYFPGGNMPTYRDLLGK